MKVRESVLFVLRIEKIRISVVTVHLRLIRTVVMSGDVVRLKAFLRAVLEECLYPLLIGTSAYCWASDPEVRIYTLNCFERSFEELKVFFLGSILPERRKIRFVPYFNGPREDFLTAIAGYQVFQCLLKKCLPSLIILRRCYVALPVEDCLIS